ncbi:MAG: DUF2092 domain-containing protein [Burkholderiaceae bacterium]|nr:DUF2092 domain-containing protein [Burkholderiaceae bacterium]MCU0964945.1 DUF2092 domain-containing protein [Burkholderiaceae bacterium]
MRRSPLRRGLGLLLGTALAWPAFAQAPAPAAAQAATAPKAAAPARPAPKKAAAKPAPFKPVLEQRAVDLLQAMSARLAAARSLSFTAVAAYEYPSRLGPPIVYTMRYDVVLQRPNQLKIVVPGDGPASEFVYDGREMAAFAPAENLVAVAAAPPTLEGALKQAFDTAAIYFPFTDLLLPDPYGAIAPGAILAYVVGPSAVVGGVKTDMVVWANDEVFLQLWIGAEDKLPRRIRAQFRADPKGLRHDLELRDWQLDGAIAAEHFSTAKAKAGQPMAFAAPGRKLPIGAKPVALQPAAKAPAKPQ